MIGERLRGQEGEGRFLLFDYLDNCTHTFSKGDKRTSGQLLLLDHQGRRPQYPQPGLPYPPAPKRLAAPEKYQQKEDGRVDCYQLDRDPVLRRW